MKIFRRIRTFGLLLMLSAVLIGGPAFFAHAFTNQEGGGGGGGTVEGGGGGGGYSQASYYSQGTYYSQGSYTPVTSVKVYDGGEPYGVVAPDATAHGGVTNPTHRGIAWLTGASVAPEGQRACYLYDPTAYPSYWRAGQYDSPGNNSVMKWDGTNWSVLGASGHPHMKELDCSTAEKADALLTSNATTITTGGSATLTWYSQYGSIRQASCTGTNFTTGVFVPAHWENQLDYYNCSGGNSDYTVNLALVECTPVYTQVWVPDGYTPAEYSGTQTVSPTQTTTYTYTCTNANGTNTSSVTINVAGTTQCTDLVDNDNDGHIDNADAGCAGVSGNPNVHENSDLPDLTAGAVTPTTATAGSATTLSATITNGGGSATGASFTNLFQIDDDSDHTSVYTTKTDTSPALAVNGTDVSQVSYTFPNSGTWYVRACADNNASWVGTIGESDETNNCSGSGWTTTTVANATPTAVLTAAPTEIIQGASSLLTWSASADATSCTGTNFSTGGAVSGNKSVSPSDTTNYSLDCVNASGGHGYSSQTVTVDTVPALSITSSKGSVRPNDSVTISWNGDNSTSCTVNGPSISNATGVTGSRTVTITAQSTYTMSCTKLTTTYQKTATVHILPSYIEK